MPLLMALDECNAALTNIEQLAAAALELPELRAQALELILVLCQQADENIGSLDLEDGLLMDIEASADPNDAQAKPLLH